jgi:hypothetical protein
MGGSNETKICGLRFHINDTEGKVHVHDDSSSTKFTMNAGTFKEEIRSAFKDLGKTPGIATIQGDNRAVLYLMNDSGTFKVFLSDGKNSKSDLENFLKGC